MGGSVPHLSGEINPSFLFLFFNFCVQALIFFHELATGVSCLTFIITYKLMTPCTYGYLCRYHLSTR